MYHCKTRLRTRIRTAPDTRLESQTDEYFEPGDEFQADEILVVERHREEWVHFTDPATGRQLYTAACHPRNEFDSKWFVEYAAEYILVHDRNSQVAALRIRWFLSLGSNMAISPFKSPTFTGGNGKKKGALGGIRIPLRGKAPLRGTGPQHQIREHWNRASKK